MRGKCLCGEVEFELAGKILALYQCHCSLCRKQSGSAASAATIVAAEDFRWIRGKEVVGSWIKDTGFRSDFCRNCGSPVPNPLRTLPYVWIPAGLLEEREGLQIRLHVFYGSRAEWDTAKPEGTVYDGDTAADMREFVRTLHRQVHD